MTVEIAPTKLNINPVLVAGSTIENVLDISYEGWSGDIPLRTGVSIERIPTVREEQTLYDENSKISAQDEFIL